VKRLPGGGSTLSRYWDQFPSNAPRNLVRGEGVVVWDSNGKSYLDWTSSLCANLLGYNHPGVTGEVVKHLTTAGGPSWPLTHPLEEEVAETLCEMAGFEQGQVRFLKTGSDACSAAIRIARAVTGRELILSAGYHGWHDQFVAPTPPSWGIPEGVKKLIFDIPYGDLDAMQRVTYGLEPDTGKEFPRGGTIPKIAAIIVEPVLLDQPPPGYLQGLRELANREGALLIFDETITGGRFTEFTAGQQYGVEPDLLVLGKGIANGWPLACVIGNDPIMRCLAQGWASNDSDVSGPVFVSGTFGPETGSLVAAQATLSIWTPAVAAHIQDITATLKTSLTEVTRAVGLEQEVTLEGSLFRLLLRIPDKVSRTIVLYGLMRDEILLGPGFNPSAAHTILDVLGTRDMFKKALVTLNRVSHEQWAAVLDGEIIQNAYRPVALAPGYGEDSGIEGDTDHNG